MEQFQDHVMSDHFARLRVHDVMLAMRGSVWIDARPDLSKM